MFVDFSDQIQCYGLKLVLLAYLSKYLNMTFACQVSKFLEDFNIAKITRPELAPADASTVIKHSEYGWTVFNVIVTQNIQDEHAQMT